MNTAPSKKVRAALGRTSTATPTGVMAARVYIVELKAQGRGASRTPLRHRIYQPDRDGAKSSLTLSIFSGEDHRRRLTTKLTPSYFRTGSIPHPMGLVRFALSSRRIIA